MHHRNQRRTVIGKVTSWLVVCVWAFATGNAWAVDITWNSEISGGTEIDPLDIAVGGNWQGGIAPAEGDKLIFPPRTFVTVTNSSPTTVYNDVKVNSGNYTFLGTLYFSAFYPEGEGDTVIVKKGDWRISHNTCIPDSSTLSVVITNCFGNITHTNPDKWFGIGFNGSGIVENLSGDWVIDGKFALGVNSTRGELYWRGGNLTYNHATQPFCVARGSESVAIVEKYAGNWTLAGQLLLAGNNGSNADGTFRHFGGKMTVNGDSIKLGERGSSTSGKAYFEIGGGIVEAKQIKHGNGKAPATLRFSGGTLRAMQTGILIESSDYLTVDATVAGGTVDTAGYPVTINEAIGNAPGESGAMLFRGGGSVALAVAPAYSGVTAVEVGTKLVLPLPVIGSKLKFMVPEDLADGVYEVVSVSDGSFDENLLEIIDKPSDAKASFRLNAERNCIVCVYGYGSDDAIWIGGSNGDLSVPSNWSTGTVPEGGNCNIGNAKAANLTVGAKFSPSSITFLPGCAAVKIDGASGFSGVVAVTNLSSVAQEIACPFEFADTYRVYCESQPVNFSGGARATHPDPDNTDNVASRKLMGDITFTADWAQGNIANPYTVPNGSVLHGKDARGTATTSGHCFLSIEAGGKAYFDTAFVSHNKSLINTDGELHVEGILQVGDADSDDNCHATHDQNDTGVIYAGGLHRGTTRSVYIKVPTLYIGKDGLGTEKENKKIYFANADKTVYATDDFEIFGPCRSADPTDWGLHLQATKSVTFNTQGHTIIWTAGVTGSSQLIKDGDGTLIFNPHGTALSGAVTVKGGTLKVMSASGVSTGEMTVTDGGTLELAIESNPALSSKLTLESGSTLVYNVSGGAFQGRFSDVKLPESGSAILRIDGSRLVYGDHILFGPVPDDASGHVAIDLKGTALDGRNATLRVDDSGNLILNIEPKGVVILFR